MTTIGAAKMYILPILVLGFLIILIGTYSIVGTKNLNYSNY